MTIEKKLKRVVFVEGPFEDHKLSYIVLCDSKYLIKVLKMSCLDMKTKDLIKKTLAKT